MTSYIVQVARAIYYNRDEVVEAATLAEALQQAIDNANSTLEWNTTGYHSPVYVEAVAEGDDTDLWLNETIKQLPIPSRFTEGGEGPHVIVTVSGGLVQHVEILGGTVRVEVRDYDTDGTSEPGDIQTDKDGDHFLCADWSNVIPTDTAG